MSVVDILAIAAHPDDVEVTCAGLLLRMADRGYKTGVLDLTRGEMGTKGTPEIRDREAAAAAGIMGLALRENARLPDSRLALNDESRISVASCLRRLRPRIVVIPADGQRHPDHNAASEIAYAAIFVAGLSKFSTDHPAHRPDKVLYTVAGIDRAPSFYVDITDQMERKLQAVASYFSQFGARGEPVYSAIESRARHFGSCCGVRYAEGYFIKQSLLIDDPISELRTNPV
jgi:bacillithiol biosynthesis deacetylase BshB1